MTVADVASKVGGGDGDREKLAEYLKNRKTSKLGRVCI